MAASEKNLPGPSDVESNHDTVSDEHPNGDSNKEWEPIRVPDTKSERPSRPASILSRTRSQNGYGCDDQNSLDSPDNNDIEGALEKDPYEVGWDGGESDPLNPRSKNIVMKWLIVVICAVSSLCVTCASSMYTSTYGQITVEFNCSQIVATLGLSLFVVGLGIGPMLLGPLSEFYGRRPIFIVSFSFFVIWLIPSAVAKNIETMLIARFFSGLAGSAFLSVSGGTVGDMYARDQLQAPMMIFTAAPFVGPSLGPLIGGFINENVDWRWTFYVLIIWAFTMLVLIVVFVKETYHPVLLKRKAIQKRKETGDERWKAPMEKSKKSIPKTIATSLYVPFQLLVLEPMVLNLCALSAILLGVLYLFFGAFALVFRTNHGFDLEAIGLSFLGIFVGMLVGIATDPLWHKNYIRLVRNREAAGGEPGGSEPEFRLPPAILGAVLVPIGIFWFGWSTYSYVHWIVPIIGSAVFGLGTLLVFSGVFTFLVDAYPMYAASALAANSFARSSFAAAFPLFGIQMYEKLGYQWASSLLGFLALALMPFPYLFFRYGKQIRGKSRFAGRK